VAQHPGTRFLPCSARRLVRARFPPSGLGNFFKILDGVLRLRMVAPPRRELAVAHLAQLAAHGLLGDGDAEFFERPLAKIDDAPTHDAMDRRRRPCFDDARQRGAVVSVTARPH